VRTRLFQLVGLVALMTCTSANASTFNLFANLSVFQEQATPLPFGAGQTGIGPAPGQLKAFTQGPTGGTTPDLTGGPRPIPSGFVSFTLDTAVPVLHLSGSIFNIDVTGSQTPGINDNLVAAHIHAGPTAIPGVSAAGVVWGFFGSPDNDVINEVLITPFASGAGGTFAGDWDATEGNGTTLTDQISNILSGHSYINFHTRQFQGGELRGQLVVPEPGSMALLAAAFGGLYILRRKTKKAQPGS
jgi:hypothetical protein